LCRLENFIKEIMSLSRTHEEFLAPIRDYNSKDSLMDVLQETRRIKVEEITRFCRKLISYVREFVEIGEFVEIASL
jgi:hypothetical protein